MSCWFLVLVGRGNPRSSTSARQEGPDLRQQRRPSTRVARQWTVNPSADAFQGSSHDWTADLVMNRSRPYTSQLISRRGRGRRLKPGMTKNSPIATSSRVDVRSTSASPDPAYKCSSTRTAPPAPTCPAGRPLAWTTRNALAASPGFSMLPTSDELETAQRLRSALSYRDVKELLGSAVQHVSTYRWVQRPRAPPRQRGEHRSGTGPPTRAQPAVSPRPAPCRPLRQHLRKPTMDRSRHGYGQCAGSSGPFGPSDL